MIPEGNIGSRPAMELMKRCLAKQHGGIDIFPFIHPVEKFEICQSAAGTLEPLVEASQALIRGSRHGDAITFVEL